jgi:GTP cyclohydrolase I
MNKGYIELIRDCTVLAEQIPSEQYKYVYGIPSGGVLPAFIVAQAIGISLITAEEYTQVSEKDSVLVVDDLIDSGNTLKPFKDSDQAVLYRKSHSPEVMYSVQNIKDEWIDLPYEKGDTGVEDHIIRVLEYLGEDPTRQGLVNTPKRVINSYKELFRGYDEKQLPDITIFDNGNDNIVYDEMIIDTGDYYSHCEHHMLPFFGKYWFAYIPSEKGKILGLSKISRVVDYFSAKLQVQERLTGEIVDYIWKALNEPSPLGMALIMKGEHLCKTMRGAKKKGIMTTSVMKGVFKDKAVVRQEFLSLIK